MRACEQLTQWGHAMQLLEDMGQQKIEAEGAVTCSALSACAKAQELGQSTSLLGRMRSSALQGDTISCSAAVSACSRAGLWQPALELLDFMAATEVPRNIITFSGLVLSESEVLEFHRKKATLKNYIYVYTPAEPFPCPPPRESEALPSPLAQRLGCGFRP